MDLDALADSARNRGLKLVRSRIRTPGKGDFGKVGLTDAAGKPLFGFDGKALAADPEEVQSYLRKLEMADWGASLDSPEPNRKITRRQPANDDPPAEPASKTASSAKRKAPPRPKPTPKPEVREAKPSDAAPLLHLVRSLGYPVEDKSFGKRLRDMIKAGSAPFVVTLAGRPIGLCAVQLSQALQREGPVGRITVLAVAEDQRGRGIGRMLVEAAESYFVEAGCELIEITSNDRNLDAHAFYRRLAYERTSIRFSKLL